MSGIVLLCFLLPQQISVSSYPDFLELTFSVTSTALQLKVVFVTSFLLLGQLHDLPHSKNGF